jgi:hypothetical protein
MVTKRPHKNKGKGIRTIGFGSSFGYPKLGLISKYQKRVQKTRSGSGIRTNLDSIVLELEILKRILFVKNKSGVAKVNPQLILSLRLSYSELEWGLISTIRT